MQKKPQKASTPDALLTETERQKKYVDQLPEQFEFPLFNTRYAIESQRKSAYKHTAAAAREIVDNAIEAGAKNVHVIFDRPGSKRGKGEQDNVTAVAFIDDGAGMLPKMARYALTWGGGTHFEDPGFIGKFGFGLPNASINQTRLVEVYTRTNGKEAFTKAVLDIRNPSDRASHTIPEPTTAPLPEFVRKYVQEEMKTELEHGTVVVWQQPDHLKYRRPANLKEHLIEDFGIIYRYLLGGSQRDPAYNDLPTVDMVVEGQKVDPVDPLFLTPGCRYFLPSDQGGATKSVERSIPVRYIIDEDGATHLQRVKSPEDLKHPRLLSSGALEVIIARFPYGFVEDKKQKNPDGYRRFQIRKARRGISFVRAGREIDNADHFPKTARDEANNLGNWPLLQSYAYHWGLEVRFAPALDEPLGVGNDKQTVRPSDDFWRVLAEDEVDRLVRDEEAFQRKERSPVPEVVPSDTPTEGELAMTLTDAAQGGARHVPDHAKKRAAENLKKAATKIAGPAASEAQVQQAMDALRKDETRRRYHMDYVDDPNGPFYTPELVGGVVVVHLNKKHVFFEVLYGPLTKLPGGEQSKQALDILLFVLAKAELRAENEETQIFYETQRKQAWSPAIEPAYKFLSSRLAKAKTDQEQHEDAA